MRVAHPNLWWFYLVYGVGSLALALNFIFLNPTFKPLGIPKEAIGVVFLVCSCIKLPLLFSHRIPWLHGVNPDFLRLSMALSVAIFTFWAGINVYEFFRLGQTSLQLPIMFGIAAALGIAVLREPYINPATKRDEAGV